MKIKTSELSGQALDFAVAVLEQLSDRRLTVIRRENHVGQLVWREIEPDSAPRFEWWAPSRIWQQGGLILDREGISLRPLRSPGHELDGQCLAAIDHGNTGTLVRWVKRPGWHRHFWQGPTPLIAAMRCYVGSKLGDEVEVPDELVA